MTRMLTLAAGLAFAGAANAAFVGGVIRVDEAASMQASADIGSAVTVTQMFIQFDEADDVLNRIGNADFSTSYAADGATLFQDTEFGANSDTGLNEAFFGFPGVNAEFDSFVGLGGPNFGGNTSLDPDFAFTSTGVMGGWFDTPGSDGMGGVTRQGVAGDGELVDGLWNVFVGQFTINGDFTGGARGGESGASTDVFSELFEGVLDIGWIDALGGPEIVESGVFVGVPAPGAAALFGVAGLTAARRRR